MRCVAESSAGLQNMSSHRIPYALCFVAAGLPVSPVVYLVARQSVVAALLVLFILVLWSTYLMRFSVDGPWQRNAWWLLTSAIGVSIIYLVAFRMDNDVGALTVIRKLTSVYLQVIVAIAVALNVLLLNLFRYLVVRRQR